MSVLRRDVLRSFRQVGTAIHGTRAHTDSCDTDTHIQALTTYAFVKHISPKHVRFIYNFCATASSDLIFPSRVPRTRAHVKMIEAWYIVS